MKSLVWLVFPSLALAAAGPSRAQEPAVTGVSAARWQSRQDLVESLIAAAEASAGRRLDEGFRAGFKARLAALPEAAWQELERSRDLSTVKSLGGAESGRLIYRTVPPCRILDTRQQGGSLAAGSPRAFQVTGIDLSPQGGNASGCGVPFGPAVGALINFVAVNPTGAGNLRAWPYGGSIPTASILNYTSGFNLANGIAIPICDPSPTPTACQRDFYVQADFSAAHLVADVVGYFDKLPPALIFVASGGAGIAPITTSCANAAGNEITVVAPAAGRILVHGQARMQFLNANAQQVTTFVGSSTNDCTHSEGSFMAEFPVGVTANPYNLMAPTWAVFEVPAAGSYTYYLNAVKSQATRVVNIYSDAKFSAVFIPN